MFLGCCISTIAIATWLCLACPGSGLAQQNSEKESDQLNKQAVELYNQGRYADAELLYKRALALLEMALGPDNPALGPTLFDLALLYQTQRRNTEAESLYRRLLVIREKALGPDARELEPTLENLAIVYAADGRNAEAEHVLRQVLAADPRSTAALTNLAGILESRLRLDEAESCLRQALTLNPELVNALGNLGNILATEGRLPEAADCYSRACALQPNLLRLEAHAATMLPSVYESADELRRCRAALEANVSRLLAQRARFDPEREPVPVNFLTAYQGFDDRELAQRLAGLCRGPNVAFED